MTHDHQHTFTKLIITGTTLPTQDKPVFH